MIKDEWYNSNDFKLLRHFDHLTNDIVMQLQELGDIIDLVAALKPMSSPLAGTNQDKYTILQQQLKITSTEAKRLWDAEKSWARAFQPNFSEQIE